MFKRILKFCVISGVVLGLIATATGLAVGLYFYYRLTRDLPQIERLEDYVPKAVTLVYAADGTVVGEFYDERRFPVEFSDIPQIVRDGFLAAEDASFYQHPGIDFVSIARAFWINLQAKSTKQGASTITQQVVKSLLLSREKTYERKAKEAILSYRLEQALTKDEIFSIYLNEIYLGSTAYGVKAAARVHFHKELKDLSIAEAAYLAGLPQKPSYLAKLKHRDEALRRQRYVLEQMERNGFISAEQHEEALGVELKIHPANNQRIQAAPYFVSHVHKLLEDQLGSALTSPGGFEVYTTLDLKAYDIAERALRRGLRAVDKRRGWRGPLARIEKGEISDLLDNQALESRGGLEEGKIYRALVKQVRRNVLDVQVGDYQGEVDLKKASWAKKLLGKKDRSRQIVLSRHIRVGDIVEVSYRRDLNRKEQIENKDTVLRFELDQTPEVEGAFAVQNALTGEVKALVGGYDFKRSEFNRATQGLRQPGSSFKPFIYQAAIDFLDMTPASLVPDSPLSLVAGNGDIWSPSNYDHKFLGPITLRTALQRSRNVVSAYLLSKMGPDRVVQVARKAGISTPIPRELSISLGTAEVKLLEMVRSYGAYAAGGWLSDSLIVTSVRDRKGEEVYRQRPRQEQIMSEETAFIMANMMKGVVERGTAQIVKKLGKPVAGKTGTTNDQMDAWFLGYTPEWVGGAWVGFDVKRMIGRYETGGKAAAPIFLYFMEEFLAETPALDFDIPDGVIPVLVNASTGRLAESGDSGGFVEYFKTGTEPKYSDIDIEIPKDYLSNDEF